MDEESTPQLYEYTPTFKPASSLAPTKTLQPSPLFAVDLPKLHIDPREKPGLIQKAKFSPSSPLGDQTVDSDTRSPRLAEISPLLPEVYELITHPDIGVDELSIAETTHIFSGRMRKWPNNADVQLILPKKRDPALRWLCKEILHVPERSFWRVVNQRAKRGMLRKPIIAESYQELISLVHQCPGGIGVVCVENGLSALTRSGVNVIKVIGEQAS